MLLKKERKGQVREERRKEGRQEGRKAGKVTGGNFGLIRMFSLNQKSELKKQRIKESKRSNLSSKAKRYNDNEMNPKA